MKSLDRKAAGRTGIFVASFFSALFFAAQFSHASAVDAPTAADTWVPGQAGRVQWSGYSNDVDILLSTDGGGSFPTTLASGAANDGEDYVLIPDVGGPLNTCAIRVEETGGGPGANSGTFSIDAVPAPTTVFSDGFESGTIFESDSPPGAWDVQRVEDSSAVQAVSGGDPVLFGTYSARHFWSHSDDSAYCMIAEYLDDGSPVPVPVHYGEVWSRMYFYIDGSGTGECLGLFRLYTGTSVGDSNTTLLYVEAMYSNDRLRLRLGPSADGTAGSDERINVGTGSTPIVYDTWHCLEVRYVMSRLGASDGIIQVWLDGQVEFDESSLDLSDGDGSAYPVDTVAVGGYAGYGQPTSACAWFDQVDVSSEQLAPDFVLLAPNGSDMWGVGTNRDIVWMPGSGVANVRVEISRDGGASWTEDVVASTPNTGSYTWTVHDGGQAIPQNNCLIRISDAAVPATQDQSHAAFAIIAPTVSVTYPNGGEALVPGRAYEVTWTSTGFSGVDILLDTDGTLTFPITLATNAADDGADYVCIPTGFGPVDLTTCRMRVRETGGGVSDDSDGDFTISGFVSTTIFADGFESGQILVADGGAWDSLYLDDASLTVSDAAPHFEGGYGLFADWGSSSDSWSQGQVVHNLSGAYGEVFFSTYVRWEEISNLETAFIELFRLFRKPNGSDLLMMLELRCNHGTYTLRPRAGSVVPDWYDRYGESDLGHPVTLDEWHHVEMQYRCSAVGQSDGIIRLWLDGDLVFEKTDMDNSDAVDSGATLTRNAARIESVAIGRDCYTYGAPPYGADEYVDNVVVSNDHRPPGDLTVIAPAGGTEWGVGGDYDIVWLAGDTGAVPNVHIELSRDGGTSWEEVIASTPNDGAYTWTVTHGGVPVPQDNCVIRVSDAVDANPSDTSTAFSIVAASLSLSYPAGAEEWGAGGPRTITWTTEGSVTTVDVLVSRDGGTTWQDIATAVANSGSHIWDVDDGGQPLPQNNCIIRVWDSAHHGTYGDSGIFTIAAGRITVTLPGGGESWVGGTAQEIRWTSNLGDAVSVNISISYNGGANYRTLTRVAGTANDGNSFFGVADRPCNQCRVKISHGTVEGESNDFTITPKSYAWLFQDGFDTGTTLPGAWDELDPDPPGEMNVVTSPSPLSPPNCLERHESNGGDGSSAGIRLYKTVDSSGMADVRCRASLLRIASSAERHEFGQINFYGNSQNLFTLYLYSDDNTFWSNRNPHSDPGAGWPHELNSGSCGELPTDSTWHEVDVYFKPSTVDNAEDGNVVFYYEGALAGEGSGFDSTSSYAGEGVLPPTRVALGGYCSATTNIDATIYYDDVSVCASNPNGPFLVVLAPSGSEEWMVGDDHNIIWHVTDNLDRDVTHVDIEISRDNGASWSPVASNVDVSTLAYEAVTDSYTYTWDPVTDGGLPTVPPQDQCLIRVTDVTVGNPGNSDECDFNFSIGEPHIEVITPNGSEVWGIGTDQDITWTSFGIGLVTLHVSWDGGTGWTSISSTNASDGSYTWPVTGPPSGICLVRIEETGNPTVNDESDATFSIVNPTLQVTAPNGAEVFNVGDVTNITWNSTGLLNVEIELSRDNGTSWEDIVASTGAAASTYSWTVTGPLSANCLVRISDVDGNPTDESDAIFAIQGLDLTLPNGGETWDAGSTQAITWDAQGPAQIDIELSRDDGNTWESIDTNVDATLGTYDWDVTGPGSIQCIIRISESTTGSPSDESESVFTIAGVDVTAPNGGELWNLGENVNITWNSGGLATVKIELSRDGNWVDGDGSDVEELVASTDATVGSWGWVVTGPSSTTCLVRISDTDGSPSDESDAVFEILAPTIAVTSPAAGDAWPVASSRDITWSAAGVANVKIDVSRDGGTSWEAIAATTSAALGSYTWASVTGSGSTTCIVRVADVINPFTIYGDSVGFTISEIAVTAPAVGDVWCYEGDAQDITWTSLGITGNVDIAYSVDGGTNWTDIVLNEPDDGSYTWTIPNQDSPNCVVRVEETGGGGAVGLSGTFTLTPASLALTSPDGGEIWSIGKTATVTWDQVGVTTMQIELSTDAGTNWTEIITDADGQAGSYAWTLSAAASGNCVVRISSGTLQDESAGTFWIINPNGDTDGDEFTDQEEVDAGTNPFDKGDRPPVMFHGKTGCGAGLGGGRLAFLAALAAIAVLKRRK